MIRVRPIHHTADAAGWDCLLAALGAVRAVQNGSWSEYDTAAGTVAISAVAAFDPRAGQTLLGFTATGLEAISKAAAAAGITAQFTDAGASDALAVIASSGFAFLVDIAYREVVTAPAGLSVQQIWYQSDLAEVRRTFVGLGLTPRVVSDKPHGWADYVADGGGLAAQHPGAVRKIELSFECDGDLDELAAVLTGAGHAATVVDEAYNRSLTIADPDGGTLTVNGVQEDLYGFHRAG